VLKKQHPIIERVSRSHGIPVAEILGKSRKTRVVRARFLCVLVLRHSCWTWQAIGKLLGDRDHSTIISAYERAKTNPQLLKEADRMIALDPDCRFNVDSEIEILKERIKDLEKHKFSH